MLGDGIRALASAIAVWTCLITFGLSAPAIAKSARSSAKPPPAQVIAFTGWAPTGSPGTSAIPQIVDRLKERGVNAEVHLPGDWQTVATRLIAQRRSGAPLVLFGYSMGAGAAIKVAETLRQADIPVSHLVAVEAWSPSPLPHNVLRATHFYSTRMADRLVPGPSYQGDIQNIDLNGVVPEVSAASHVSMSHMAAVQDIVVAAINTRPQPVRRQREAVAVP